MAGLRREEVALLAGVSIDYYNRLERGNLSGVSESVLDALARALQLDEAERAHLFDLARTAGTTRPRRRTTQQHVRPTVQRILDAMTGAPAYVRNGRLDVLAANALWPRALRAVVRRRPGSTSQHGAIPLSRPARSRILDRLAERSWAATLEQAALATASEPR